MDAETFLAGAGSQNEVDYDGEMIILATTAVAGSSVVWTPSRDGFILGYRCNLASGFAIGINVDLPAVAGLPADGSVTIGLIDWTTGTIASVQMQTAMKIPFVANDAIRVRIQGASKAVVQLYVGYPKQPVSV